MPMKFFFCCMFLMTTVIRQIELHVVERNIGLFKISAHEISGSPGAQK